MGHKKKFFNYRFLVSKKKETNTYTFKINGSVFYIQFKIWSQSAILFHQLATNYFFSDVWDLSSEWFILLQIIILMYLHFHDFWFLDVFSKCYRHYKCIKVFTLSSGLNFDDVAFYGCFIASLAKLCG